MSSLLTRFLRGLEEISDGGPEFIEVDGIHNQVILDTTISLDGLLSLISELYSEGFCNGYVTGKEEQ